MEFVMVACFAFNAVCNPFVLAIVKLPSVMVACLVKIFAVFKSISSCKFVNEDWRFKILEILKLPSVMVACFAFNAVCNPFVLLIVKLPSVMVACLVEIFAAFKYILSCKFVNEDWNLKF